jgi:hypothetical protein
LHNLLDFLGGAYYLRTIKKGADMWQQWLNFLAGLWLVLSSFLDMSVSAMQTNFLVTGIIVAVLAIWGAVTNNARMGSMTR